MRTLCIRISDLDYSRMRTCAETAGISLSQLIRTAIADNLRDTSAISLAHTGPIEVRLTELAHEVHSLREIVDRLRSMLDERGAPEHEIRR